MKARWLILPIILIIHSATNTAILPPSSNARAGENETTLLRDEAKAAHEYLNRVRQNPALFSEEIGVDLKKVKRRHVLQWNDTLAAVAEEKARDMATRNYFGHQNPEGKGINIFIHKAGYVLNRGWVKDEASNNFESLGAGYDDGLSLIRGLLLDEGSPRFGHRIHLLGMKDFWADCQDIGIGIARNSKSDYGTYSCIIIAKHDF